MKQDFTIANDLELKRLATFTMINEFNVCRIETTIHRTITPRIIINKAEDINEFVRSIDKFTRNIETKEICIAIYLSRRNAIIAYEILSEGGLSGTVVEPINLFKNAILISSQNIVLIHNHPSGALFPSESDKDLTKRFSNFAKMIDMKIMDHVIINKNGYFSFANDGLL